MDSKERVARQLKKEKYDFSPLNGLSDKARELIAETPITNDEVYTKELSLSGKGKLTRVYDKISDAFTKSIVLRMPQKNIEIYLGLEKEPKKQQAMIDEVVDMLTKLDEAEETKARLDEKYKAMDSLVDSTQATIGKLKNADTDLVKEINTDIDAATNERKKDHPDEVLLDKLIAGIREKAGRLIGEERIASAKDFGSSIVEKITVLLASPKAPADVKPYFTERLAELTKLLEGTDALRIDDVATEIAAELVKRTDPVYRAKGSAEWHSVNALVRILLERLYNIKKMPYSNLLIEINTKHVAPLFETYKGSMTRSERQMQQHDKMYAHKTYAAILEASLFQVGKELKAVHNGEPDFANVNYAISNNSVPFFVEQQAEKVQQSVLGLSPEEILDDVLRFEKTQALVKELKEAMQTYLVNESGIAPLGAQNIVEGFFIEALERVPNVVSENFYKEPEEKEETVEKVV